MYAMNDDDVFLSPESIIRSAMSAADLQVELDADAGAFEVEGWARRACAASGFGDGSPFADD